MDGRLLLTTGLMAALLLVPAQSSSAYETILQDDAAVMGAGDEQVRDAMTEMKQLGVDRVRITVPWRDVSPQGRSGTRPARFDASDPAAYQRSWDEYFAGSLPRVDRAVYAAHAVGLKVMLDLAFGAPLWATTSRTGATVFDGATRPSPTEFAAFAKAMARRYSGNFSLPWAPLPAVDVFELWNEPNIPYFLRPQFEAGRPVSADWYRDAVAAAYPAIKSVRPRDTVLIGSTAADGTARAVAPLAFLRRLAELPARPRRRFQPPSLCAQHAADRRCRQPRQRAHGEPRSPDESDATADRQAPASAGRRKPLADRVRLRDQRAGAHQSVESGPAGAAAG